MPKLIIHAPSWAARAHSRQNYSTVLRTQVGHDYAINLKLHARVTSGCKVVVLDKNTLKRAEGVLVRLAPTRKTANGIQRYDVIMKDLVSVAYKPEKLNRCGIAVL